MIRTTVQHLGAMPQVTQATGFNAALDARFKEQQSLRIPRSEKSWGAEETRLGSWNTGVGAIKSIGEGAPFKNGYADPRFDIDPEDTR